jgi:D-glycero-D-manno-heptose 1,7-bisphosphate phosphatase
MQSNGIPSYSSVPQMQTYGQPQQQQQMPYWPNDFPNPVVGLERDGIIMRRKSHAIKSAEDCEFIPESLEAIRTIRLKGHKLMVIFQQPEIARGNLTQEEVEVVNQHMMQAFGQAGIMSIDGMYYSTSNFKNDMYAKPNTGMFKRASDENPTINWKKGWYVGNSIEDLKAADKIGSVPVLIRTDVGEQTEKMLNTFSNKALKKKTLIFDSLMQFANSL